MTHSIPPKPTKYKGVQYRSRLEASWAVFWEALINVDHGSSVTYEDWKDIRGYDLHARFMNFLGNGLNITSPVLRAADVYVPDFRVLLDPEESPKNAVFFFQEAKPAFPGPEYCQFLRVMAHLLAITEIPFVCTVGGFYGSEGMPRVHHLPYVENYFTYLDDWLSGFGYSLNETKQAIRTAKNFRWDLYKGN